MAKTIEVTCPHCNETFVIEQVKKPRGQLAGIALADMTDEQLKREIINANSVYYKAKQRGADEEVLKAHLARIEAAKAERDARSPIAATETPDAPAVGEVLADSIDGELTEEV